MAVRIERSCVTTAGLALAALMGGCGATQLGDDVPLARDCSAPSEALDLCDIAGDDCALRVYRAVACFADSDAPPPPLVRGAGPTDGSPSLPSVTLEPAMLEVLMRLHVRGATLADAATGALREPRWLFRAHDAPPRAVVEADPSGLPRDTQVTALAHAYGLALALAERPLAERLAATAGDLEARLGEHAVIFGRAAFYASLTNMAAHGSALRLSPGGFPAAAPNPDGALGWVEHLHVIGWSAVHFRFGAGGDPDVAALVAAGLTYGEVADVGFEDAARDLVSRRPPPLAVNAIRVPDDHRVVASFAAGAGLAAMAGHVDFASTRIRGRAALVDTPRERVVVWVVGVDATFGAVSEALGDTLAARGLAPARARDADWEVLVVGATSTATAGPALAQAVLRGLP